MARKKIYLHVGVHKTATCYIQEALKQNAATLARQGILYYQDPEYADQEFCNHTLALSIRPIPHPDIHMTESSDRVWSRFLRKVASFEGDRILVSSEVFMEGADKEFMQRKLADYQIRLVFYLREQSQMLGSVYSELVRHGHTEDVEVCYEQFKDSLDYFSELERWAVIFGEKNLIVRDFEKVTRQLNILHDLLCVVGLSKEQCSQLRLPQCRINKRYPAQLVELLLAYNKLPVESDEKIKFRKYLDYLVNNRPDIANLSLFDIDEHLQLRVRAHCKKSNARLSEKYAPKSEVFFAQGTEKSNLDS